MSGPLLTAVGQDSDLFDEYRSSAVAVLSSDDGLQAAKREWATFLTNSHGDIFSDLSVENPRETLFVETLYYDFLVDQIIDFVETEFGLQIGNRDATANTDALSFSFRSLHERIRGSSGLDHRLATQLDRELLGQSDQSVLRGLYETVVSREMRRQLGQYYTPRGLADCAVGELDISDFRSETVLDPGCGSGVFLAACIDAKRDALSGSDESAIAANYDPDTLVDTITNTVFGIDLNPVAVKTSKLRYVLSLLGLLEDASVERIELPVFLTDALALTRSDEIRFHGSPVSLTVDHLVGNPPWITWGDLPEAMRAAWRERYIDDLDLFPQAGMETRLGHGNDDISVPFVWVCIHRYLDEGGDGSFVLKRDLMRGPAGRVLRAQQVGSRPLAVTHVHDFNQYYPFDDAEVRSAIYTIRADRDPEFPVSVDSWSEGSESPDVSSDTSIRQTFEHKATSMVSLGEAVESRWVRADAGTRAVGECAHEIRHGVKDDAKAVFSIDRDQCEDLEHDHLYPYLRSKHIVKYGLFGHDIHLVPLRKANADNETALQSDCPRTYAYLQANRDRLDNRSSTWLTQGTFYNMFGLGEYTWSAYKVVWCRLGFKPHFAVVSTRTDTDLGEKPVIPGDHCMFIATNDRYEAHFLCGLLNAAPYQQSLKEIAAAGKSSLSKGVVSRLELPAYSDTATARRLAELSMAAHEIVPEHTDVSKRAYNKQTIPELEALQTEIDECVERMLTTEDTDISG